MLRGLKRIFICLTADAVFISLIWATLYTLFGIGGSMLLSVPEAEASGYFQRLYIVAFMPVLFYLVSIFVVTLVNTLLWTNGALKERITGRIMIWFGLLIYTGVVVSGDLVDEDTDSGAWEFLLFPIIYCIANIMTEHVWERLDPRRRAA